MPSTTVTTMAAPPTPIPTPRLILSLKLIPSPWEGGCEEAGLKGVAVVDLGRVEDFAVVLIGGALLETLLVTRPTQMTAADPIPLPVGKKRQTPTDSVLTSGEIEGVPHSLRSEIIRFGFPSSHVGREIADIAAVPFVSRQLLESNEVDGPVGFVQPLSENNCTAPWAVTDLTDRIRAPTKMTGGEYITLWL